MPIAGMPALIFLTVIDALGPVCHSFIAWPDVCAGHMPG